MPSLSSHRKALRSVDRNDFEAVVRQRDEARAEVARLREALREIERDARLWSVTQGLSARADTAEIAREALEAGER